MAQATQPPEVGIDRGSDQGGEPSGIRLAFDLQWVGMAVGVILAVLVYALLPETLSNDGKLVAAVAVLMAVWWATEAAPIAVTALAPVVVFPVAGLGTMAENAAPYANPINFLVLGGVILGLGMARWGLHRRLALRTVSLAGTRTDRVILALMLVSAFISAWVSATATAVIMIPIGASILKLIKSIEPNQKIPRLTASMLLGIAYSVTIGSMTTLIGYPGMALMRAFLSTTYDIEIPFGQWMLFAWPFALVMIFVAWVVLTKLVFRPELKNLPGGRKLIQSELVKLGRFSTQEKLILSIFLLAIFFWVVVPFIAEIPAVTEALPMLGNIEDAAVAIMAAVLIFILPNGIKKGDPNRRTGRLLDWEATKEVPWGLLILFGSGLSLSAQFSSTGLSTWVGDQVTALSAFPAVLILLIVAAVAVVLTEMTSNTATAAALFPVMGAIAVGIGVDPLIMTIVVILAVSSAFMLPVATPANAVAFTTNDGLTIQQMMRAGVWMNIVALILIVVSLYTLLPLVFGVSL